MHPRAQPAPVGSESARARFLRHLAATVPSSADGCIRVGIDGPDGSGKTWFADELATALRDAGRAVFRVSADDFHHVRAVRYRRGRDSPEGCWLDSYDYDRLQADVLAPLGPDGDRRYRPRAHDLVTDEILDPPWQQAEPGSVLVLDGLFLHRDELAGRWDFSVFLDVPFAETARRLAARDGSVPDPTHPSLRRYVEAQRLYFRTCTPQQRAGVVVDNADLDAPRITTPTVSPVA